MNLPSESQTMFPSPHSRYRSHPCISKPVAWADSGSIAETVPESVAESFLPNFPVRRGGTEFNQTSTTYIQKGPSRRDGPFCCGRILHRWVQHIVPIEKPSTCFISTLDSLIDENGVSASVARSPSQQWQSRVDRHLSTMSPTICRRPWPILCAHRTKR